MARNLTVADSTELEKQQDYADKLASAGFDFGLAVGSAFVESMRNTHYNTTATALDELIDNAIEAGARSVHIAMGYDGSSDKKPSSMAIIDDGHGMVPNMIRLAVAWGGTHREGSRTGFGRFGFGLPSASVNQGRRFSVYSVTPQDGWHGVTIDLDDIKDGKLTDKRTARILTPPVEKKAPPEWVLKYVDNQVKQGGLEHGTVIVWEKLDRLTWRTTSGLTKNLLEHFGITFRNYIPSTRIFVDQKRVEPTDPLFTTPGYRFYDLDEDRARPVEAVDIEVKSKDGSHKVPISLRYSRLPLTFFARDKEKPARLGNQNERFSLVNGHTGIIICRMGRQIDVVDRTPWKNLERFRNNDRYWKLEVDFPAELDEEFSISNNKQGVVPSDRFWDILQDAGVEKALRTFRAQIDKEQHQKEAEPEQEEQKGRTSERSMAEAQKFKSTIRTANDAAERERLAKEALEQEIKRRARSKSRPPEEVRKEIEEEVSKHPYKVKFEDMPGAPFFRVEQIGGMKILFINRDHRFYGDVYAMQGMPRQMRAALEVLLFVIGDCELDAQGNPDRRMFYSSERQEWSAQLASALEILNRFVHETEIDVEDSDEKQGEAEETGDTADAVS